MIARVTGVHRIWMIFKHDLGVENTDSVVPSAPLSLFNAFTTAYFVQEVSLQFLFCFLELCFVVTLPPSSSLLVLSAGEHSTCHARCNGCTLGLVIRTFV